MFWRKRYTSKYTGKEIDEAIAKASGSTLPEITSADVGKAVVAMAGSGAGEYEYGLEKITGLPAATLADNGKVVGVGLSPTSPSGVEYQLKTANMLPAVAAADVGKVATVSPIGVWVAQTPASDGVSVPIVVDTSAGTVSSTTPSATITTALMTNQKLNVSMTVDTNNVLLNVGYKKSQMGGPLVATAVFPSQSGSDVVIRLVSVQLSTSGVWSIVKNVTLATS